MDDPEMRHSLALPGGAPSLSPVHQHEVILQQWALGVGPHHTHQAAGMQLLVLVEGVGQLVHGLTGRRERKRRAEDEPPARVPVPPGLRLLPSGLPLFLHFTHEKKSRELPVTTNSSSLLF